MVDTEASLSTVKEWQKKSSDFFSQSNDGLFSLIAKGFETMSVSLSEESDLKHVKCALLTLESQRLITLQFEENDSNALRSLVFGLIESVHLTLHKLHQRIDSLQINKEAESRTAVERVKKPNQNFSDIENNILTNPNCPQGAIPKEEECLLSNDGVDVKEEDLEYQPTNDSNESTNLFVRGEIKEEEMDEEMLDEGNEAIHDHVFGFDEDSIDGEEEEDDSVQGEEDRKKETTMSSRRRIVKPKKYDESFEYYEDDAGPSQKKTPNRNKMTMKRSSSPLETSRSDKVVKESTMKLDCPVPNCDYWSSYPKTWLGHLRIKHNTTPGLAHVALKCECGYQSLSCAHSRECDIAQFTVVKTNDGPIRRKRVATWITPKCMMDGCNKKPSTLTSFTAHIHRDHVSSLIKEGVYLTCECGTEVTTHMTAHKHNQKCPMHNFALHRFADD